MSETKKQSEVWRSEASREERKARLAAMRSKTGGKKPIRLNSRVVRTVVAIVLVLALLAYGGYAVIRAGIPTRMLTAATIGNQSIKGSELNFYFHSIANQYGISATTAEGKATLSGPSNMEGFKTLADYIKDSAAKELQNIVMLSEKAKAENMTLSDASKKQLEDYFASAEAQATTQKVSVDKLFADAFGSGMTKELMRPILERILLANQYSDKVVAGFTITDGQLKTEYDANKDTYDFVRYRSFLVKAVYATDASDEVKSLAMKAAKDKADKMLAEVKDADTFKKASVNYATDADQASYMSGDKTLSKYAFKADVTSTEGAPWLFDAARKAGDKSVFEASDGYEVYLFESRSRAYFNQVSVRHILIGAERNTLVSAELKEKKAEAEKVLAEYKAGAQTAEAFGALAEKYSTDTGSSTNGGLYENIKPGSMVDEFDAWIMDPARKAGDTGIVQTDYGFHVMYFEKVDGKDWELTARNTLKNNAYDQYLKDEAAKYPYTLKQPGLMFVG